MTPPDRAGRGVTDNGVMAANDDAGPSEGTGSRPRARDLNEQIRYTMWSVFRVTDRAALDDAAGGSAREDVAREVTELLDQAAGKGTVTRGCYDLQGLRADADYMIWWHAPTADDLQEIYTRFRRTRLGRASEPVWSAMALHRPAEFNKGHIPAFLADEEPKNYVSVYPFVRSYEWYLIDPAERRKLLAEHGMMAREYPDVRANTVASFSSTTTSGSWPSKRTSCTGSSTSCGTCAAPRPGGTPGWRSRSTLAAASRSVNWSPLCRSRGR